MELKVSLVLITWLSTNIVFRQVHSSTCNAYSYPGNSSVDIKFVAILCLQTLENGTCSGKYYEPSIKQAIALDYAIQLLNGFGNESQSFIRGVRFGIDFYDDCCSEYLASRHVGDIVSYIKGNKECGTTETGIQKKPPIAGVIGTSISQTTTVVAEMMSLTNVPMVGISATLPELSDKSKYPTFVRAVPSDLKLAQVIIEIAKKFNWSYIIGLHTDDKYGVDGMKEIKRLAPSHLICMSWVETFNLSSSVPETQMEYFMRRKVFSTVEKAAGYLGIVYFGGDKPLLQLLNFVKAKRSSWNNNAYMNQIYWVTTDAVSGSEDLAKLFDEYKTKILIIEPPSVGISSFNEYYFKLLETPPDWITGQWRNPIKGIMNNALKCPGYNFTKESLAGCNIRSFSIEDKFMAATFDAVYLLANKLRASYSAACLGESEGMCVRFQEILQSGLITDSSVIMPFTYSTINPANRPEEFSDRYLMSVNRDFEAMGRNQFLYSIRANTGSSTFSQIGSYKNDQLIINQSYTNILKPSQCRVECSECMEIGHIDYLYSHGSPVLIGLFSIHLQSVTDRFACGKYRNQSLNYVETVAFMSTVMYLRNTTGIPFGYLIIDDCYNTLRMTKILSNIFSGAITVIDDDTQQVFNGSDVAVLIGAQSSKVTLAILPFLDSFGIPVVSYSATNPTLIDPVRYPFFSRTVSSDLVQARAIIEILKRIKVTYVGSIVYKSVYALDLYNLLRPLAQAENICMDESFEMDENTTMASIGEKLRSYRIKFIDVIVILAVDEVIRNVLDAVTYEDTFIFIASEAWGVDLDLSGYRGERARGSIVLGLPLEYNASYILQERLQSMNPYSENTNDWMRNFWQQYFQCNLPGSFSNVYRSFCPERSTITEQNLTRLVTPLIVHTAIATLSAGLAIKSMIDKQEPRPFNAIALTQKIRSVSLKFINGSDFHPFLESGDGSSGFFIYNIQLNDDKYEYVKVGDYSCYNVINFSTHNLKFYDDAGKFYDDAGKALGRMSSICSDPKQCSNILKCSDVHTTSELFSTTQMPLIKITDNEEKVIALAVVVGILSLFIIVMFILLFSWRQNWLNCVKFHQQKTNQNKESANFSGELTSSSVSPGRPELPPRIQATSSITCISDTIDLDGHHLSAVTYDKIGSVDSDSSSSGQQRLMETLVKEGFQYNKTGSSLEKNRKRSKHLPISKEVKSSLGSCTYAEINSSSKPLSLSQLKPVDRETIENTKLSTDVVYPLHIKPIQEVQPITIQPQYLDPHSREISASTSPADVSHAPVQVFPPADERHIPFPVQQPLNMPPFFLVRTNEGNLVAVPAMLPSNYPAVDIQELFTDVTGPNDYLIPTDPHYLQSSDSSTGNENISSFVTSAQSNVRNPHPHQIASHARIGQRLYRAHCNSSTPNKHFPDHSLTHMAIPVSNRPNSLDIHQNQTVKHASLMNNISSPVKHDPYTLATVTSPESQCGEQKKTLAKPTVKFNISDTGHKLNSPTLNENAASEVLPLNEVEQMKPASNISSIKENNLQDLLPGPSDKDDDNKMINSTDYSLKNNVIMTTNVGGLDKVDELDDVVFT